MNLQPSSLCSSTCVQGALCACKDITLQYTAVIVSLLLLPLLPLLLLIIVIINSTIILCCMIFLIFLRDARCITCSLVLSPAPLVLLVI
eukprot:1143173-Pelagomonas_calceolata.AAC.4